MAFPKKFKSLLETQLDDIEKPDTTWLTYSVCGCSKDACGWAGWVIEGVFRRTSDGSAINREGKILPADSEFKCPRCELPLFRTDASIRFSPSPDQTPVHGYPGVDYERCEMEYED